MRAHLKGEANIFLEQIDHPDPKNMIYQFRNNSALDFNSMYKKEGFFFVDGEHSISAYYSPRIGGLFIHFEAKNNCDNSEFRSTSKSQKYVNFLKNTPMLEGIEESACDLTSKNAGDKFHCSVDPNDFERAAQLIFNIMDSPQCPFRKFKVSHALPDKREEAILKHPRVFQGAQFTFYAHVRDKETNIGGEDKKLSLYSADTFVAIGIFFSIIEKMLDEAGIPPGKKPESDIYLTGSDRISYRNERFKRNLQGENILKIQDELRNEPFFQYSDRAYTNVQNREIKIICVDPSETPTGSQ
ncbi:MAG: hypothetical protein C5B47_08455 [Verrucomicrobia bacterium]|nr:MAG: hypothetical protein C5B47_08455 [Verrucomicrobiota bacterium]